MGDGAAEEEPLFLSREDRIAAFGFDCAEQLEWSNWVPGGEYVRQLLVKNVSQRTQKVKYELPATKYFSLEFPESIRLSPGMSFTVAVTFRYEGVYADWPSLDLHCVAPTTHPSSGLHPRVHTGWGGSRAYVPGTLTSDCVSEEKEREERN